MTPPVQRAVPKVIAVAARSRSALGSRADETSRFTEECLNPDGGFRGRSAASDLYYTAFGLDCRAALGFAGDTAASESFVAARGDGEGLDFIHLVCLARCWSRLAQPPSAQAGAALLQRLERYRCDDGGYHTAGPRPQGSAYGAYLSCSSYACLGARPPGAERIPASFEGLCTPDGGYANEPGLSEGAAPATSAVLVTQALAGAAPDRTAAEWLVAQADAGGGFRATARAPIADLLSTGSGLYALLVTGRSGRIDAAAAREFVLALRHESGGFRGHLLDDIPDLEYTFHAMLALGCLDGI